MDKTTIAIATLTVIIFGGIVGSAFYQQKNFQPRNQCVQHNPNLGMHIHPNVQIEIDGQPQPIPANIGINPTCMKAIHTHDETGKVHLEYSEPHDFTLADFFAVWGKTFNKNQILDKQVDEITTIRMTVDGQPNEDYENLVLKDEQKVIIKYEKK